MSQIREISTIKWTDPTLSLHWIVAPVSFSSLGSLLPILYPCLGRLGSKGSQREFITSGSDALDLKQFLGADATIQFIHLFECLFGILNSRNPCAKVFKFPLHVNNKEAWAPFLSDAFDYIFQWKNPQGQHMSTKWRRLDMLGFLWPLRCQKNFTWLGWKRSGTFKVSVDLQAQSRSAWIILWGYTFCKKLQQQSHYPTVYSTLWRSLVTE